MLGGREAPTPELYRMSGEVIQRVERRRIKIHRFVVLPVQSFARLRGHVRCGGGEIRTHGPVSRTPHFKCGAIDQLCHSSVETYNLQHTTYYTETQIFLWHVVGSKLWVGLE